MSGPLPDAGFVYRSRIYNEPHDPKQCCASVSETNGWGHYQCLKKPSIWRDVLHNGKPVNLGYCGTHDPVKVAARAAKRNAEDRQRRAEEQARWAMELRNRKLGEAAIVALEQIAAGHNDPRQLAHETLERFPTPIPVIERLMK